jgi:hypothetical protein
VNSIEVLEGAELFNVDFYPSFHLVIWFDLALASENGKNLRAL